MNRIFAMLLLVGCTLTLVACATREEQAPLGGDTHWLAACGTDADCGRGSCLCGVCSEPCEGDGGCAGTRDAACYEASSPGVTQHCAGHSPDLGEAVGLCLATCAADADCFPGTSCVAGACITGAVAGPDAGAPTIDEPPRPDVRAREFADLVPQVEFDSPVAFPEPRQTLTASADESVDTLVGTWREVGCGAELAYETCLRLEIERSAESGEVRGTLIRDPLDPAAAVGPFAPPVDPDRWYPEELSPDDYFDLVWNALPGADRTLLDARFDGDRLEFWVSPMELWSEWCALQDSYPVPGGEPVYQCAPPSDEAQGAAVDLGKRTLCTSELSGGLCEYEGAPIACNCMDGEGMPSYGAALCSPAACHCDEDGCIADWNARRHWAEMLVEGNSMTVTRWFDAAPGSIGSYAALLEREVVP